MQQTKLSNILLAMIVMLLALNAYYSYLGALQYGVIPKSWMNDEERNACLASEAIGMELNCRHGWYLKGYDPY